MHGAHPTLEVPPTLGVVLDPNVTTGAFAGLVPRSYEVYVDSATGVVHRHRMCGSLLAVGPTPDVYEDLDETTPLCLRCWSPLAPVGAVMDLLDAPTGLPGHIAVFDAVGACEPGNDCGPLRSLLTARSASVTEIEIRAGVLVREAARFSSTVTSLPGDEHWLCYASALAAAIECLDAGGSRHDAYAAALAAASGVGRPPQAGSWSAQAVSHADLAAAVAANLDVEPVPMSVLALRSRGALAAATLPDRFAGPATGMVKAAFVATADPVPAHDFTVALVPRVLADLVETIDDTVFVAHSPAAGTLDAVFASRATSRARTQLASELFSTDPDQDLDAAFETAARVHPLPPSPR